MQLNLKYKIYIYFFEFLRCDIIIARFEWEERIFAFHEWKQNKNTKQNISGFIWSSARN